MRSSTGIRAVRAIVGVAASAGILAACSCSTGDRPGGSDAGDAATDANLSTDASELVDATNDAGHDSGPPGDSGTPIDGEMLDAVAVVRFSRPDLVGLDGSTSLCDLDHDGSLELIAPLSAEGAVPLVAVIDATTGVTRWTNQDQHGAFASPACVDVNADGTDDVITGGRNGDVFVMSGVDGATLFTLGQRNAGLLPSFGGFAFSTVRTAGTASFVTLKGERTIPSPGRLVAFGLDGVATAIIDSADGREIYSSPAIAIVGSEIRVAFGTGGETIDGHLYLYGCDLDGSDCALRHSVATSCMDGGFISSPVLTQLDADAEPEVVTSDYCGRVLALDDDFSELWSVTRAARYGSSNVVVSSPASGPRTIVAVLASVNPSVGSTWSGSPSTTVLSLDPSNGDVVFEVELPMVAFATPALLDVDGDDVLDVILPGADLPTYALDAGLGDPQGGTYLLSGVDGATLSRWRVGSGFATPLVDDVDTDGDVDVFLIDGRQWSYAEGVIRVEMPGVSPTPSVSGFRGHPSRDGYAP